MTATPVLPTGEQFALTFGEQRATVTEVGATLRSYVVGGREVLDTFDAGEMASGGRGQVLLPWPNRIADGRYTFLAHPQQLPLSEPARRNASHGLTRWANWVPRQRDDNAITLGLVLHPQSGYPFTLDLALTYTLTEEGLAVRTTARNSGATAAPFGAGYHPYFTVGTALVDEAIFQLPAATRLTTDERMIPTGRAPVAGTDFDFQSPRAIGATQLDTCFTDFAPDRDGRARIALAHPAGARRVTLVLDPIYRFVQVYSGDNLPDRPARRRGLAIEPMTCPANAFNSGDGLLVLQPGEAFIGEWRVSVADGGGA